MRHALVVQHAASAAVLLAAGVTLGGCGSAAPAGPSAADSHCRAQWSDLADSIAGRTPATQAPTVPSMLADRWNSVSAGVQYYVTSATAKDCGDTLSNQRLSINALIDFGNGLQTFDMEYQRDQIAGPAHAYLDSPLPRPRTGRAVPKKAVERALATLTSDAASATADMAPGWTEANSVDLADVAAVNKALSDLTLLGDHSAAYQQCRAALATIRKAISQLIG